jgi:hypothetical protein
VSAQRDQALAVDFCLKYFSEVSGSRENCFGFELEFIF